MTEPPPSRDRSQTSPKIKGDVGRRAGRGSGGGIRELWRTAGRDLEAETPEAPLWAAGWSSQAPVTGGVVVAGRIIVAEGGVVIAGRGRRRGPGRRRHRGPGSLELQQAAGAGVQRSQEVARGRRPST